MNSIDQHAAEFHRPRCGNCHHAVNSVTVGAGMVACSLFLEYRCADNYCVCEHHICHAQIGLGDEPAN